MEDFDRLLSLSPKKLAYICSVNQKMAEIAGSDKFVKAYAAKHILKKPILPKERAPDGYMVYRKWHWAYETWASDIKYQGHEKGEIPHFNIKNISLFSDEIYHVYLDSRTKRFLIIDSDGNVIHTYK